MAELIEGKTGTAKDGTRVIVRNGQIVPLEANPYAGAGFSPLGGGMYKNKIGQTYREGPKGGFSMIAGPSQAQADEATEGLTGYNKSLQKIDGVDAQLRKTKSIGPWGIFTNPTDMALLQQGTKDLLLSLKEKPYNLGVLNGPDLQILEDVVANPGKLKDAVFRQTLLPRLANLSKIVGDGYRQDAAKFGALGGNPDIIPLYRSPRSKYTAEEWGTQGKVPPTAMSRGKPAQAGEKRPPLSAFQR